jgi:hypothetical protein
MSEDKCPLCFEELNVPEYRENNTNELIIEGGTTRLECGHAYHSRCVVQMIRSCQGKCAQCNATQLIDPADEYDTWRQRVTFEGKCKKALANVKKDTEISEGLRDVRAFREEIDRKRREFDKLVIEAQKKIAEDLKIEETIDLFEFSKKETMKRFKKKARDIGSLELATIAKLKDWRLREWLFGREEWHTKYSYTKRYFFGR